MEAVLELTEKVESNKEDFFGVFLDLQKAFDTVDHELLKKKLERYGIRGNSLMYLSSFLENRKQYLAVGTTRTRSEYIKCRVPQGSVLGPLLFIIFINNYPFCLQECTALLFADDTCVLSKKEQILADESKSVTKWMRENKLVLNVKKNTAINFRRHKSQYSVAFGNANIQSVTAVKYLGIYIDRDLNFKAHFDYLCTKVAKITSMLRNMREILIGDHVLLFYNTNIKPVLQYGNIVYGNTNKTQMDRLCLMQRNAIRAMFNMSKHSSVDQVRVRLKILTVSELYIYDLMKSQCSNAYAMSLIVNA